MKMNMNPYINPHVKVFIGGVVLRLCVELAISVPSCKCSYIPADSLV